MLSVALAACFGLGFVPVYASDGDNTSFALLALAVYWVFTLLGVPALMVWIGNVRLRRLERMGRYEPLRPTSMPGPTRERPERREREERGEKRAA